VLDGLNVLVACVGRPDGDRFGAGDPHSNGQDHGIADSGAREMQIRAAVTISQARV
jgi:hypothetical protein